MNKPTLEEVKEYFKDAKIIEPAWGQIGNKVNITENVNKDIFEITEDYWIKVDGEEYCVYDDNVGKYAKILEYKETRPERYSAREVNGMDVIDLVKHWNLNFNEGNILKYLLRDKGEDLEDMQKIIDYATREYKHLNK